jgi:endonuclease/exonuclease/phosphatase family metal-dependent hydrolase
MSYLNTYNPYERIEEGPAILSRYPIIKTDYLLLSRDPNDPNDAHQRICLHAVIDYPRWGLVDIYVTHLSLSERSREKTMLEIWRYIQRGEGVTQVLLGDLNAEPQSRGIRFLQGKEEMEGEFTDLTDAWLEKHEEAEPRSQDPIDRKKKFTFPSDNPSKRIDFILFRGNGVVKECEIIGQEPTKDTAKFSQNLGMLNAKSPVWASDHRGVVMELEMNDD